MSSIRKVKISKNGPFGNILTSRIRLNYDFYKIKNSASFLYSRLNTLLDWLLSVLSHYLATVL